MLCALEDNVEMLLDAGASLPQDFTSPAVTHVGHLRLCPVLLLTLMCGLLFTELMLPVITVMFLHHLITVMLFLHN